MRSETNDNLGVAQHPQAVSLDHHGLPTGYEPSQAASAQIPAEYLELCSSVSGVDYGADVPQRLHSVTHLTSMTYRRRIRLEVAVDVEHPHVPSLIDVYPTADWQERETWDMFGIVFDGHPALTRILMPDDWQGHPQRKDYPLEGPGELLMENPLDWLKLKQAREEAEIE
mgnify:CR=1 FL=1